MAEICCGVVSDNEASGSACDSTSRTARRRRMEIRRFRFVATGVAPPPSQAENALLKRQRLDAYLGRDCANAVDNCVLREQQQDDAQKIEHGRSAENGNESSEQTISGSGGDDAVGESYPKYGVASVCGRRRDMEDSVSIRPSFYKREQETSTGLHYFGVYDGHGCSHVATKCRERMHELVKEELESNKESSSEWKGAMERSFSRMDKEVIIACNDNDSVSTSNCRCELQMPECDAVGSTAVVAILTPDKIIVANCGDSRAVLSRNGKAVPLSSDHKPDRPDELNRIEEAGGRVIYWDGPRVLGVLAMSRAIGDNYLKPYVSCEPEVMVLDRTAEDECLILASDGLWDVVSNETACGVARMCLRGKAHAPALAVTEVGSVGPGEGEVWDKACSDASMLLTKLALARHSTDNVSVVVVDLRRVDT